MTFFRYATTSLYIIVHLDTRKSLQLFLFGSVKNATKFEQKKLLRKRFPLKEKGEETTIYKRGKCVIIIRNHTNQHLHIHTFTSSVAFATPLSKWIG